MTVFVRGKKYENVHKVEFMQEDCNVRVYVDLTFADGTLGQAEIFNIEDVVIHE